MNHTSEDHEWARKARAGEPGYRERYFFYDNWDIPREFEKTVPQVFPHHRARQLYLAGRLQAGGHDQLLSLPVGPQLRQPHGLQ